MPAPHPVASQAHLDQGFSVDIEGQMILCWGAVGGWPVHCGIFSSLPHFHPPGCDKQKCPQTLPSARQEATRPPAEKCPQVS